MGINTLFNETELAIFQRQTGFTFGEYFKSDDGVIFAVDGQSGLVFVGRDLLRANVHKLGSVSSVSQDEDGIVVSFKDSSSVKIKAGREDAGLISGLLGAALDGGKTGDIVEEDRAEEPQADIDEGPDVLIGVGLAEFYSRLVNTGRSQAIGYLVSETGMSVEDACKYVDELAGQKSVEEPEPESDADREYYVDGTMTEKAIFAVVKKLRPGDRIHVEFKPFIGKMRVYDAEYRGLRVDSMGSGNISLAGSYADDFKSLMEEIAEDLFDYLNLCFFCEEDSSELSCRLQRVTILKIASQEPTACNSDD